MGTTVHLAPFEDALRDAYREIAGIDDDGFGETLERFSHALARSQQPQDWRLFGQLFGDSADRTSVDAAYRRFLDKGHGAPEETPGQRRAQQLRTPFPIAAARITPLPQGGVVVDDHIALGVPAAAAHNSGEGIAAIPAEAPPWTNTDVPRLSRFGDTALWGSLRLAFRDVVEFPSALTVVRTNDGYSAGLFVHERYQGDIHLADDYMARIRAIEDPALYLRAWNDHIQILFQNARTALTHIEELQGALNRGASITPAQLEGALLPFQIAYDACKAFNRKPGAGALSGSWENTFVATQIAKLNNLWTSISMHLQLFSLRMKGSRESVDGMLHSIRPLFDPYDHLRYSYAHEDHVLHSVIVDLPPQPFSIAAANPAALRRIIDAVVYTVGRDTGDGTGIPHIQVSWDEATSQFSFTDVGSALPAFRAYQDISSTEAPRLAHMSTRLGSGAGIVFATNPTTGDITRISLTVPQASAPSSTITQLALPTRESVQEHARMPEGSLGGLIVIDDAQLPSDDSSSTATTQHLAGLSIVAGGTDGNLIGPEAMLTSGASLFAPLVPRALSAAAIR